MPIFKTFILGSQIEINYEEKDKNKLHYLIKKFKSRLNEFPNNGKANNNTIIFLASLKIEDSLNELEKLLIQSNTKLKKNIDEKKIALINLEEKNRINEVLKDDIILLDNQVSKLQTKLNFVKKKIEDII